MPSTSYTRKERLAAALGHREADRIPLDLGSTKVTGINITAYRAFLAYQDWEAKDPEPGVADAVQQLARVHENVLLALGVDTRGLMTRPPAGFTPARFEDGRYRSFTDDWGITWRMPKQGGRYYDISTHPMPGDGLPDLASYPWPDPLDESVTADFDVRISAYEDFGLVLNGFTSGIFEMALRLRGFEQFLTDLYSQPAFAEALLDKITQQKCAYWERTLRFCGDKVLVAAEADDLGTQHSLLLSPAMYRAFLKPRHARIVSLIKKTAPGVKVFLHSCGAVRPLIPDFIEAGFDILNPVQVAAEGMEPRQLKKDFGDCLTFWGGGVDTQHTLPHGTPAQVADEVRRHIEDLAPGGGFVFNAIHNIQGDVPPQNIEAMFNALRLYGDYAGS